MGITACGGKGGNESKEPEQPSSAVPSEHKHSYGKWTQTVAPTCTEKGKEERVCECGDKQERDVNPLGHDFSVFVSDTATCTVDGEITYKCVRCEVTDKKTSKAHHNWGEDQTIPAGGEGQVAYKMNSCQVETCNFIQAKIGALDGTIKNKSGQSTSIKSGTPSGYFKLASKNDKATWTFNVPGTKGFVGMLYQRGMMDAFQSNTTKTYAWTSTSGDGAPEYTKGNFDVTVNGVSVDKSAYMNITFQDMTADGEDSGLGSDYSPLALCPIGQVMINAGVNVITYERLGSYNLVINELVFIGEEFDHQHQAASEWSKDENQHWHACTAPGCPIENYKMDAAAHTWGAAYDKVDATCSAEGSYKQDCTVCGYTKTVTVAKEAHQWGEWTVLTPATCAAAGERTHTCDVCGASEVEAIPQLAHSYDPIQSFPADDVKGTIAASAYACSICGQTVLQWNAEDFDAATSTDTKLVSGGGVQMVTADKSDPNSSSAGGACVPETVGTKYVYKIDAYEAAQNVGLEIYMKTYSSYGNPHIFASEASSDWKPGYVMGDDGQYHMAEFRYGVSVNGVNIPLGEDNYDPASNKGKTDWFDFGVQFDVVEGLNTIEILCLGGYPADAIFNYRLVGMPEIEVEHVHTYSDWQTDANNHWKVCTDPECPLGAGEKFQNAPHDMVLVEGESYAATCTEAGLEVKECSVCGYRTETAIAAKGHTYVKDADNCVAPTCGAPGVYAEKCSVCNDARTQPHYKDVGVYSTEKAKSEAPEGCAPVDVFNCTTTDHHHSVYEWAATAYNKTISEERSDSDSKPELKDAGLRFGEKVRYQNKDASKKGSHIVYYIDAPEAISYSVLSVYTAPRNSNGMGVFAYNTNDTAKGYELVGEEFVTPTHRIGLIVNGERVQLGYDDYGSTTTKAWYSFPASIQLNAGVNEIELFNMGGYRLTFEKFRLSGMPEYVSTHEHTIGTEWVSDDTQHWHACVGEGCDDPTFKADAANHTWGDVVVTQPATCTEAGAGTKECTVCHKVVDVVIEATGHEMVVGAKAEDSALRPLSCSHCSLVGYELQVADLTSGQSAPNTSDKNTRLGKGSIYDDVWTVTGIAAGTYEVYIQARASSGNDNAYWNAGTAQDHGDSAGNNGNSRDYRYKIQIDESEQYINVGNDTERYSDFGLSSSANNWTTKAVATITITESGATTITLHNMNNGYAIWVFGMRLVKVA